MKLKHNIMIVAALFAASLAWSQDQKPVPPVNFLSLQHPEWPPLPLNPDPRTVEVLDLGGGEAFLLDEHFKYPAQPAPATNALAKARTAMDSDFSFDTNYVALHPDKKEKAKAMLSGMFPTNSLSKRSVAAMERQRVRIMAEVDRVAAASQTNNPTK